MNAAHVELLRFACNCIDQAGLGCPVTFAQKTAPNLRLGESTIEKDRPGRNVIAAARSSDRISVPNGKTPAKSRSKRLRERLRLITS